MRVIDNWRRVLRHAWSVHLNVAAVFFLIVTGLDTAWPFLNGYLPISNAWFGVLGGLLSAGALLARFIPQDKVSGEKQ
ncbi:hypothetical protein NKJ09_22645 [Mesorhizobium sp. M0189]|uniref:DUF7940 domain-containing protein n=1 Tax=Mesorhizobium sp. M0189 TaxID=2956909 RepID=UPI00333810B3